MNIYSTISKTGRLADKRIRICIDECIRPVFEAMDLVFTKDEIEDPKSVSFIVGYGSDQATFRTNDERLRKFFSKDKKKWTSKAIKKLAEEEKKMIETWYNGENFYLVLERWNAAEREWTRIDSLHGIYGREEAIEHAKDMLDEHETEAIIVTCEPDCVKYFDVVKG